MLTLNLYSNLLDNVFYSEGGLNSTCPHRILKRRTYHAEQLSHFKSLFCKQKTADLNFNIYKHHL